MKLIFDIKNANNENCDIILKGSTGEKSANKRKHCSLFTSFMTVFWGVFFIMGMGPFPSRKTVLISYFSVDAFSFNARSFRTLESQLDSVFSSTGFLHHRHRQRVTDRPRVLALRLYDATSSGGIGGERSAAATVTSMSTMNAMNVHGTYHDNWQIQHKQQSLSLSDNSNLSMSGAIDERIQYLLSDDKDEENDEIPDYSEQAANEIADKRVYSRISEQAKWKANVTMQNNEERTIKVKNGISNLRPIRASSSKVTASVQETGGDSMSEYVKSMASHELLSPESEVLLGRHIQLLVQWEESRMDLEKNLNRPPTFQEWSDKLGITVPQLKQQIRRSHRAKAALIEANLRLVVTVARQTVKQQRDVPINFQDACQEGMIGLSIACEKFDPEKGFRFSTYAVWWIRREVQKNIQQQSRSVRLPKSAMKKINDIRINERVLMNALGRRPTDEEVAEKCNLSIEKLQFYKNAAKDVTSLDKSVSSKAGKGSSAGGGMERNEKTLESLIQDKGPTPDTIAEKEMFQNDVRRLIKTLSPREQAVIRLRFGLDDGAPKTLEYIATKFKVDKELIRKVEAKALLKLRQPYRNQSLKCYISDL
mmetsp:Transcript_16709/g.31656  ORF Transcript_16709/g.31656 Transcript_16709/m.31656 type:complete len:594 (+) Transcript_16709:97-1878(+)